MQTFQKYLQWAVIGLLVYMPFHIFLAQYLSTYTNGLEVWKVAKDVVTAVLVATLVSVVLLRRKYTRPYIVFVGFAVVYLLLHLVVWFGTNQPGETGLLATIYNNRIVWYLLIGYSIALLLPDRENRTVYAKIVIAVSFAVCLFGLAQWLLPKDLMVHFGYSIERGTKPNFFIDDKLDFPRIFSTLRDPNSLGAFLLLPISLLIAAMIRFWKTDKRMLVTGLLMIHGIALLLTFSRGAWLGGVITVGVLFALLSRKYWSRYVRAAGIPVAVIIVVFTGVLYTQRDSYFVKNIVLHSDESTVQADPNELRVEFLQKSINGIEANPEGNGPGTAGLVSTRLPGGGLLTENYYLQIAYEVGVIGLLLFLAFMAYILRLLWAGRSSLINQGLIASFVGLAAVNLLIHGWSNEALAATWFIVAGVAIGFTAQESSVVGQHVIKPQPAKRKASVSVGSGHGHAKVRAKTK